LFCQHLPLTQFHTLSLHDALPICPGSHGSTFGGNPIAMAAAKSVTSIIFETAFLKEVEEKAVYLAELLDEHIAPINGVKEIRQRSEEHTSELQSRFDLVCRLLLEK